LELPVRRHVQVRIEPEAVRQVRIIGAVPLSRETGFSPWEEGHDTKVALLDPRYGL
jgi:hypothetical protein